MKLNSIGVLCCLLVTCTSVSQARQHGYQGHKVFRIIPENEDELEFLKNFLDDNHRSFETWREPTEVLQPVDVHVKPQELSGLVQNLSLAGLRHQELISDLNRLLEEHDDMNSRSTSSNNDSTDFFSQYHSLKKIYNWLHEKASSCPSSLHCEVPSIGKSFEGRDLPVFKISTAASSGGEKRSLWVDAGIHAREWISISTALYFIHQLVDGYSKDSSVRPLVKNYDWYIMPVINPDGYQYSWTTDRLWRKTRSRRSNETSECVGVDPNRNFNFLWNTVPGWNSEDPCSGLYPGVKALSEPETRSLARYLLRRRGRWALYLTLHSFSQLWMAPWGYTTHPPPHYQQLMEGAEVATAALEAVYGTKYQTGSASKILYRSSGTSRDWAAGVLQVPFVYTAELRDTGDFGFVLPPAFITPVGRETWAGLSALVRYIHDTAAEQDQPQNNPGHSGNVKNSQGRHTRFRSRSQKRNQNSLHDIFGNVNKDNVNPPKTMQAALPGTSHEGHNPGTKTKLHEDISRRHMEQDLRFSNRLLSLQP